MTNVNALVGAPPVRRVATVIIGCLIEARPTVLVIFLMRFLCGCAFAAEPTANPERISIGALSWTLAILFIYLLNGVMDVHEDRVNASRRPIATGALAARTAGRVAWGAAALSVCCGAALGLRFTVALVAILVVGYLYSAPPLYLKRHAAGTSVTGALLGLLTYYGGHAVSGGGVGALPVLAIVMSLWMALVGAPSKDLPDAAGDAAAGRRTLAVLIAEPRLRLLISATALGLGVAFVVLGHVLVPVLLGPAVAVLAGSASVTALCLSRFSRHGRAQRRRPYKAFMATQYTAHIAALARVAISS
jgi:4-hydroxybenzoate polyprenyltransferase